MLRAFAVFDDALQAANRLRRSLSNTSVSPSTPSTTSDAAPQSGYMMRFGMSPISHSQEPGHVWFNSPMNSAVDITPYSKIYGMHPRNFNFDSSGSMQLTPRGELLCLRQTQRPAAPGSPVAASLVALPS